MKGRLTKMTDLNIKSLSTNDKERYLEFCHKVFCENEQSVAHVTQEVDWLAYNNPWFDLNWGFYIEDKGKIVSSVLVTLMKQNIYGSEIKVAELDLVGTLPEYRHKGYISAIMQHLKNKMTDNNMFLVYLIGIPNFYQQFGFEYAAPDWHVSYTTIDSCKIDGLTNSYIVKKCNNQYKENDLEICLQIYHAEYKDNFGCEIRTVPYFKRLLELKVNKPNSDLYYVYKDNIIKGYAWIYKTEYSYTVKEIACSDNEALKAMLDFIKEDTTIAKNTEIGFRCPINSTVSKYLYKKGGKISCPNQIYQGAWASMYWITDLGKAFDYFIPIIKQRISDNIIDTLDYVLSFWVGFENINIRIYNDTIEKTDEHGTRIDIPKNIFIQLFTGYRSFEEVQSEVQTQGKLAKQLCKIIFPGGYPYIWTLDINDAFNEA
jgi:predicted acetyltransferase